MSCKLKLRVYNYNMEISRVLHKTPITVWLTIILQEFLFNNALAVQENSLSAYFVSREHKRLAGHDVKRFNSLSFTSCIHSCLRSSWCTSTNFKESFKQGDKGTCELNKHDIGPFNGDINLIDQLGVTFSVIIKVIFHCNLKYLQQIVLYSKKETFFHSNIISLFSQSIFSCFRAVGWLAASMEVLVCLTRDRKNFLVCANCRGVDTDVKLKRVRFFCLCLYLNCPLEHAQNESAFKGCIFSEN